MNLSISSIILEENKIYALLKRLFSGEKHLKREDNFRTHKIFKFLFSFEKSLITEFMTKKSKT